MKLDLYSFQSPNGRLQTEGDTDRIKKIHGFQSPNGRLQTTQLVGAGRPCAHVSIPKWKATNEYFKLSVMDKYDVSIPKWKATNEEGIW